MVSEHVHLVAILTCIRKHAAVCAKTLQRPIVLIVVFKVHSINVVCNIEHSQLGLKYSKWNHHTCNVYASHELTFTAVLTLHYK